jgi:bis(5'-nucleosidyl)-tetraphosphatase
MEGGLRMVNEMSCGAVVYHNDLGRLRFVVIRQRNGRHYGFPKGHMENGETELQTAYREIKEETGLEVRIIPNARAETTYSPRFMVRKKVIYFLAEAEHENAVAQPEEVSDIMWLDEDDVMKTLTYNNDKDVFRLLVDHLKHVMDDL